MRWVIGSERADRRRVGSFTLPQSEKSARWVYQSHHKPEPVSTPRIDAPPGRTAPVTKQSHSLAFVTRRGPGQPPAARPSSLEQVLPVKPWAKGKRLHQFTKS